MCVLLLKRNYIEYLQMFGVLEATRRFTGCSGRPVALAPTSQVLTLRSPFSGFHRFPPPPSRCPCGSRRREQPQVPPSQPNDVAAAIRHPWRNRSTIPPRMLPVPVSPLLDFPFRIFSWVHESGVTTRPYLHLDLNNLHSQKLLG
jgi:hypothetical protein